MKLSLITVTYNSAETLIDTIQSVREQQISDLEYIVVDGNSKDSTLQLLSLNEDIITRWISEPDNGIYDAMNKGLKMATGDIIGFLHADDQLSDPDTLKSIVSAFTNEAIDFLYGDLLYVQTNNPEKTVRYWKSGHFKHGLLNMGWMPPHPTVYFKRNLISKVGFFDTTFKIAADYDWILRCLICKDINVFYLPKVLVRMRIGGASNKSIKNIYNKTREDYRAIRNNGVGGIVTLLMKNISKIPQFFKKNKAMQSLLISKKDK